MGPVGSSWADEIEEGDTSTLPPSSEKIKGDIKMVTDYSFNEDGKKVKTVRHYKIERKMVPKIVAASKRGTTSLGRTLRPQWWPRRSGCSSWQTSRTTGPPSARTRTRWAP